MDSELKDKYWFDLQNHYFDPENNLAKNNEDFGGFESWINSLSDERIKEILKISK